MSKQDLRSDLLSVCAEHVRDDSVEASEITPVLASVSTTVQNDQWTATVRGETL